MERLSLDDIPEASVFSIRVHRSVFTGNHTIVYDEIKSNSIVNKCRLYRANAWGPRAKKFLFYFEADAGESILAGWG